MVTKNKAVFYFILLIIFGSFTSDEKPARISPEQRNLIIEKTSGYKAAEITFAKVTSQTNKHYVVTDSLLYEALNGHEKYSTSHQTILAHFTVNKEVLGIISHSRYIECDQPFDSYDLQVVQKNGAISPLFTIKCEDNNFGIFEKEFSFKNDSILLLTMRTSSEWAAEDETKPDTLFTSNMQINIAKMPFDTLKVVKSQTRTMPIRK